MLFPRLDARGVESRIFRRLPEIYVAVAVLVSGCLCLLTPAFLVPDEANHVKREVELGRLELMSEKTSRGVGALVDTNLLLVMDEFAAMQHAVRQRNPLGRERPDGRVNVVQLGAMQTVGWAHHSAFSTFQNTAIYPPLLYVPQAIGWRVADVAGLTILHSLLLARLLAAGCAIAIGWMALRLCGPGRWILFACLLLPAELSLNASCSQDALLLPVATLAAVILSRALQLRRELKTAELLVLALLLVACIGARVAYLPLALVLVLPAIDLPLTGWRKLVAPILGVVLILTVVGLWQLRVRGFGAFLSPDAHPALQVNFLRHHPLAGALDLAEGTLIVAPGMAVKGLEVLGENDAFPPAWVYVLLAAGVGGIAWLTPRVVVQSRRASWLLGGVLLATGAAISLAMYITWTGVASHRIEGLQHRYYLPLVPFVLLLLPAGGRRARPDVRLSGDWRQQATLFAAVVYLVAVLYTPWVAAHRFYGLDLTDAARLVLR